MKQRIAAVFVGTLLAYPIGRLMDSFLIFAFVLLTPLIWIGFSASPSRISPCFRFYAAVFLVGSLAQYYVICWERCYDSVLPSIEPSNWLLAVALATDLLQFPMGIVRSEIVDWLYFVESYPRFEYAGYLAFLHPLALIFFPLLSAGAYTWLRKATLSAMGRSFSRLDPP